MVTRGKYLTVAFPHPDVGLTQVFRGETAECVCQGLRNVLGFVGGVPGRAVFDNATEVGGRVGGEARTSELFRRFAAHYGLDYTFTNPYSGNEKGNVENYPTFASFIVRLQSHAVLHVSPKLSLRPSARIRCR